MAIIQFQLLDVLLMIIHFVIPFMFISATPSSLPNYPIAKPGCIHLCGNIAIPFPFGTTTNCSASYNFLVHCNHASNPPKLFLRNRYEVEIASISLDGQLTIMSPIAKNYTAENGSRIISPTPNFSLSRLFTVNNIQNKLTVVGCASFGYIEGWRQKFRYYITGCISSCSNRSEVDNNVTCGGLGCCQIMNIPNQVRRWELKFGSYQGKGRNNTESTLNDDDSYVFLVEENALSNEIMKDLRNVEKLPMLVDWAIESIETCDAAKNTTGYACSGQNTECYEPKNGKAYGCQCESGYQGNPYLHELGGCKDINECNDTIVHHNCIDGAKCVNNAGGYVCVCPNGYKGNGFNVSDGNGTHESGCYCPKGYNRASDTVRDGGCKRDHTPILIIVTGISVAITLLILLISVLYVEHKKEQTKKRKNMFFAKNGGELLEQKLRDAGRNEKSSNHNVAEIYSSEVLKRATNNYHASMIVGEGGYGTVYRGEFKDSNRLVAIKKPKAVNPAEIDQFINEVFVLSQISHRNVVKLLGCCLETEIPLLVYEYIERGTLHSHIHKQDKNQCLHWNLRLKIATETADVLSYLHSGASIPIIHRDVKSANILLDHNSIAKVSDFGASKFVPMDVTRACTLVQGTFGYLDPEYMQTGELTDKSDVYSFGVVLLELLTGMMAVIRSEQSAEPLSKIFLDKLKQGCLSEILDKTIVSDGNMEQEQQITEVAKLAERCLNVNGEDRPSMKRVAMELEVLRSNGKESLPKPDQQNPDVIESIDSKFPDGAAKVENYSASSVDDSLKGFNVGR